MLVVLVSMRRSGVWSTYLIPVILGVLVLVVFSVFCLTPTDPGPRVQGEKIRLDDVLNGKFKPNPFNATWQKGR